MSWIDGLIIGFFAALNVAVLLLIFSVPSNEQNEDD